MNPKDIEITKDLLEVGMTLIYKGDHCRHSSKFLNIRKKEEEENVVSTNVYRSATSRTAPPAYPMPWRNRDSLPGEEDKFKKIPCKPGVEFALWDIERDRVGKKGKKLADLYILRNESYPEVEVGLVFEDVMAKFELDSASRQALVDTVVAKINEERRALKEWESQMRENGW